MQQMNSKQTIVILLAEQNSHAPIQAQKITSEWVQNFLAKQNQISQ